MFYISELADNLALATLVKKIFEFSQRCYSLSYLLVRYTFIYLLHIWALDSTPNAH